ncbi:MAG: pilus assembly protein, partial [Anaerolineae bacterium]
YRRGKVCPSARSEGQGEKMLKKDRRRQEQKKGAGQEGQSLAEFAFSMPLLVILLVGVIAISWAGFCYVSVTNGARQGARWVLRYDVTPEGPLGAAASIQEEIESVVEDSMPMLDPNLVTVVVSPAPNEWESDTLISVQVLYQMNVPTVTIPYLITEGGVTVMQPFQLQATSRMRTD